MGTIDYQSLIVTAVVSALVGGSGFVGILFFFIKRYLEKNLDKKEAYEKKRREYMRRRKTVTDEKEHAEGRLLFWIHKAIVTGEHNGDLEHAWTLFQEAESKEKELDREIVVDCES